jgi:hypothetical protein
MPADWRYTNFVVRYYRDIVGRMFIMTRLTDIELIQLCKVSESSQHSCSQIHVRYTGCCPKSVFFDDVYVSIDDVV